MTDDERPQNMDSFLLNYTADELRNAPEVLSDWIPYLTRGLCKSCKRTISDGIRSLRIERDAVVSSPTKKQCTEVLGNCNAHSIGSIKDSPDDDDDDTHSVISWKDESDRSSEHAAAGSLLKKSWADMAMEEEFSADEEQSNGHVDANDAKAKAKPKVALSRDQREDIRFRRVQRKKDFKFVERVDGRSVNILDGLELYKGVFSAAEQKRIVSCSERWEGMAS